MSKQVNFRSGAPIFSPDIQQLIDQTVELMKLDIVQGLAFEQEPEVYRAQGAEKNPSKLGPIVARRLRALSPQTKRSRKNMRAALPVSDFYDARVRELARRHNVDLGKAQPVTKQVELGRSFAFVASEVTSERRLLDLHENLFSSIVDLDDAEVSPSTAFRAVLPRLALDPAVARILAERLRAGGDGGTTAPPAVINKGLAFRVHRVKCVDETNPEWPGDDEIAMGGTAIDANQAATKIPEFRVGNSFDDGESKYYSPPRVLKNFSLSNVPYPAEFAVVAALAEKDSGGMSDFLHDLWEAIKDEVGLIVAAVGAAAGAAIGGAIGGTLGTAIGGPLGAIIGAVAGAILGALIGWIISAAKDDIFTPQAAGLVLPTPDSTFAGGSLVSPVMTLDFRDHGGHYRVYYSWAISR